jgi:hypothetical protein
LKVLLGCLEAYRLLPVEELVELPWAVEPLVLRLALVPYSVLGVLEPLVVVLLVVEEE